MTRRSIHGASYCLREFSGSKLDNLLFLGSKRFKRNRVMAERKPWEGSCEPREARLSRASTLGLCQRSLVPRFVPQLSIVRAFPATETNFAEEQLHLSSIRSNLLRSFCWAACCYFVSNLWKLPREICFCSMSSSAKVFRSLFEGLGS